MIRLLASGGVKLRIVRIVRPPSANKADKHKEAKRGKFYFPISRYHGKLWPCLPQSTIGSGKPACR